MRLRIVLLVLSLLFMALGAAVVLPSEDTPRVISGVLLAWIGLGLLFVAGAVKHHDPD